MTDLSLLICSTNTRWESFGRSIQQQVWPQYDALSDEDQQRIEILMLTDNKTMMLGDKRNVMVDAAQGTYIVFVDDDDRIADDYMKTLLDATKDDSDCIVFNAEVTLNGGVPKLCRYRREWLRDFNTANEYRRIPNHICAVKRELARKASFPSILKGEDSGYSKVLLPMLKTQTVIDRTLYYYDYSDETTETQSKKPQRIRQRKDLIPVIDVVMLSKGSTPALRAMTQKAVDSCVAGANGLAVNVIVMEGVNGVQYNNATTVEQRTPFGYNTIANDGARLGSAEWIMVANNDLIFTNGWAHALIAANHPLVSPKEPNDPRQRDITEDTVGDRTGRNLSGWCFMVKRSLWEKIGGFDERFKYFCADDSVIEQCKAEGIQPMLVVDSIVHHLQSKTGGTDHGDGSMTWAMIKLFSDVYYPHRLTESKGYKNWLASTNLA